MNSDYISLYMELGQLAVYRGILKDGTIKKLLKLFEDLASINKAGPDAETQFLAYDFLEGLITDCERLGFSGRLPVKYVMRLILKDENTFSLACENRKNYKNSTLYDLALRDIKILSRLAEFDFCEFFQVLNASCEEIMSYKPVNNPLEQFIEEMEFDFSYPEKILEQAVLYYSSIGCGIVSENKILGFDGSKLYGKESGNISGFASVIGLEAQKRIIRENMESLFNGSESCDMILRGSRGAGKKSLVRALAGEYFARGLRIVELDGEICKKDVYSLLKLLGKRGKFFIVYVGGSKTENLKIFDGILGNRPKNVIFCAIDEVERKTNFAPWLAVDFKKPGVEQFINVVCGLAKKEKISVPEDIIKSQALEWIGERKDFSGGEAKRFINHFKWELTN